MPSPLFKPGQTTLGNIRRLVRSRADLEDGLAGAPTFLLNDTRFIKDGEIDQWAQLNQAELYDELISKYSDDWFLKPDPFEFLTNGSEFQDLPDDFYNLRGVSWVTTPGSSLGNLTLKPFMMGERDVFTVPTFPIATGLNAPYYKLVNSNPAKLWLRPRPSVNMRLQVWYSPRLMVPQEYFTALFGTLNYDDKIGIDLGDGYLYFTCSGIPITNAPYFILDADPTVTAANFAAAVTLWATTVSIGGTLSPIYGLLTALVSQNNVAIGLNGSAVDRPTTVNYIFVPQDPTVSSLSFWPASDPAGYTSIFGTVANAGTISNVVDGVNGWEQWIITQCCINACQKQRLEDQVKVFYSQMGTLKKRLDTMATKRDSGMPQTVTDVRYTGGFPFGNLGSD